MKISNETKIGVMAAVAITFLILGFNFLKGKNLFDKNHKIYAVFPKVNGLANSNPVLINGLQVGMVYSMQEKSRNIGDGIIVTINLARDINIPSNSVAYISQDLLGGATLIIEPGNSTAFLADGDTLGTKVVVGLMDEVKGNINPAIKTLDGTLQSLDSLVEVAGTYFDPATKKNFHQIVSNLTAASNALNKLMNAQNSALNQSLANVNTITANLAGNNEKINSTLDNVEKATGKLANAELESTIAELKKSIEGLNTLLAKANSRDGSLGLLINDPKLYNNLTNTTRSLNILLDDFKTHPKRYVNVSVFGKKDKSTPLSAPLNDSTNAPQQQ
ncbi:MlaD family protein [Flavihumibacter rivuli]|uniref:MlaD family protein n=1 Tax=Flavihumibacter rivuli TaxID=2838156 RepID=UPI001BDE2792|nr:MlaD family protein [Flavihumibacter rivuli]ULQ57665.1 MlaD family protein [Flavihumibacter rivuli]